MKIKIVLEIKDLEIIKDSWCDLFASSGDNVFQSFEFNYYSWVTELSKNILNRLCVVMLYDKERVSTILPLYIDSRKRLRFINDKHADFCDVLSNQRFDIADVLLVIRSQVRFDSAHFINLTKDASLYNLYKKKVCENSILKPIEKYSDLILPSGNFPDNVLRYTSKQKTTFRRVKKRNANNTYHLLLKEHSDFPISEICYLKKRMIDLSLRRSNFLDKNRLLFLEELYNSNRMLVSMVKDNANIHAISFILRKTNNYLFWIDMYDDTKMVNIYNYISFMEHISRKDSVEINFGRGVYNYKIVNFKPDVKSLFGVYIFEHQLKLILFLLSNKIHTILKLIYKKIKV